MNTSRKAAISLLISILLFGGFSVLVFTGLFNLPETGFYDPSVTEEVFLFPTTMKLILIFALFLTTYLIIFLLFNLRQDPLVVVQNRLKRLQISIIEQFYERKGEADWARWILELEQRREEIRALIKRGVKTDSGSSSGDMDILINRSWDELLIMLGSKREAVIDEEKIASILNRLLEARSDASLQFSAPLPMVHSTQPSSGIAADGNTGLLNKASEKAVTLSASMASAISNRTVNTELAEEIEVLEELDDTEIHEDPEITSSDVDTLARQIEFNNDIMPETTDNDLLNESLEVVSPFSAMDFDLSSTDDTEAAEDNPSKEGRDKNEEDELNMDAAGGLPLITTPFSGILSCAVIETLKTVNTGEERQIHDDGSIINEREGIHYINDDVLAPSPEFSATLNKGFKELVDEVTK